MKKVWVIAPFASIGSVGLRNRFKYLCNKLHNESLDVTLFTSNFGHRKKEHVKLHDLEQHPFSVRVISEPGYTRNVSVKRALSHIGFSQNLYKSIKKEEKPDLIYCAYPTMTAAYVAGKYAKANGIPFILDVQDIWPESISAALDTEKLIVRSLMWPFTQFANKVYKMADVVFGVSETYAQRANVKGSKCKEFISVYIGSELEKFDNTDSAEVQIDKNKDECWITYIGTLSHSYDIDTAIRAFHHLKEHRNLKLHIFGTGPDEARLVKLAKELDVYNKNVFLHGFMSYEKVVCFLKNSDIALNAIRNSAKQTVTNKLGDYVSAGLPILNSCQETEVLDLIKNLQLGENYIPENEVSLQKAILNMISDREQMLKYSHNSRMLAEMNFDRKESYKVIVEKIKEMCSV